MSPPLVQFEPPKAGQSSFAVKLINRGQGIGPVSVWLNNQQVVSDARPEGFDTSRKAATLRVLLLTMPNQNHRVVNKLEVRATNGIVSGYKSLVKGF